MKLFKVGKSNRIILNYSFFIIQFLTVILLTRAGKTDYIKDVLFTAFIVAIYIYIEGRYKINVRDYARGCIILLISVHNFAGKYFDLYLTTTFFDKALHIFGTYSVVLFFFSIMDQFMKISFKAKINKFIFLVLLGVSLGAIFEILQFAADIILNPAIPNQAGLKDTNLDMISNLIGALAAAFHLVFGNDQLQRPDLK